MKKMMMIVSVGLMSTTLFVGCQNVSPENKRIGSAAIGGGAGGAVGKGLGGNIGAGLGAAIGAGVAANAKGANSKNTRNSAIGAGVWCGSGWCSSGWRGWCCGRWRTGR